MWKEGYRIGVNRVDKQHKALLDVAEKLICAIEQGASQETYEKILTFLKNYTIVHFREEEAYQLSIGSQDIEVHKEAHSSFKKAVLEYEKRLVATQYDIKVLKDLEGTLTSWLIYHVAHMDQNTGRTLDDGQEDKPKFYIDFFLSEISETLQMIAGLNTFKMKQMTHVNRAEKGSVFVDISLVGDINGNLFFEFTEDFALNLLEHVMQMRPQQVDEMVCSALAEITNISVGSSSVKLSTQGIFCDMKSPIVSMERTVSDQFGGILMDTEIGKLIFSAKLDQYDM